MWTIKPSGILSDADGTFYTKGKSTKMVGTLSSRQAQVVAQKLQILEKLSLSIETTISLVSWLPLSHKPE
jgi:hypothetical protein